MKIIGGYRELTGEEFGIYIKRVIAGGLAAMDGRSIFGFRYFVELLSSSAVCLTV